MKVTPEEGGWELWIEASIAASERQSGHQGAQNSKTETVSGEASGRRVDWGVTELLAMLDRRAMGGVGWRKL